MQTSNITPYCTSHHHTTTSKHHRTMEIIRGQLGARGSTGGVGVAERYKEVFKILAEREYRRGRFGQGKVASSLEKDRYSISTSLKYERSNRYSNILSYDKTSVKVKGKGYLNANIVVAKNGHWWVAAQVSRGIEIY